MTVSRVILKTRYPVPDTSRYLLVPHDYRYPITGIARTQHTLNTTQKSKQRKTQQNKTTLVQSPFATLSQETSWAYSTISRVHTGWLSSSKIFMAAQQSLVSPRNMKQWVKSTYLTSHPDELRRGLRVHTFTLQYLSAQQSRSRSKVCHSVHKPKLQFFLAKYRAERFNVKNCHGTTCFSTGSWKWTHLQMVKYVVMVESM